MRSLKLFITVFFLQFSLFAQAKNTSQDKLALALDKVIKKALSNEKIVGTVIIVMKDGKVLYKKAAGYADRESKRLMKMENPFRLASNSKLIRSEEHTSELQSH